MEAIDYNDILFKAMQSGKLNEIKKHLPNADINYVSPIGLTFLHLACTTRKTNIVKLILNDPRLDLTSTLETRELPSPIHIAYQFKDLKIVNHLLEKEPEFLNTTNISGETILHLALKHQQLDLIEELLNYKNIDMNKITKSGLRALDIAKQKGNDKITALIEQYILNQKIDTTINQESTNKKIKI